MPPPTKATKSQPLSLPATDSDETENNNESRLRDLEERLAMMVQPPAPRHVQYVQPMPLFDGTGSFPAFWAQFDAAAEDNRWTDHEKLQRLPACLSGKAAAVAYDELTEDDRADLTTFRAALRDRFTDTRGPAFFIGQLEARRMGSRETTTDYAADIKRLSLRAFPTADPATRNTLAVRHFVKGIQDANLATTVALQRPRTVDEARQALDEVLDIRETVGGQASRAPVRAVSAEEQGPCSEGREEIREIVKAEFERLQRTGERKDRRRRPMRCYTCGGPHLARDCRSPQQGDINGRPLN